MTREVYFETITPAHRRLVQRCLRRGDRVLVYDFTYRLRTFDWLRPLIDAGRVERIYVDPLSAADHEAIRGVEWLYPRRAGHRLVARLAAVFGRDETDTVLKKALVEAVYPYFFIRLDLERRRRPGVSIVFVPDTYRTWERAFRPWSEGPSPLTGIRMPRRTALWSASVGRLARRTFNLRVAAGTVLRALRAWRATRSATPPAHRAFDHVYAIDQFFQTKFEGGRRFDFLIDGTALTQKNTAFLVRDAWDGPWTEQARAAGYEIVRRRDYAGLTSGGDAASPRPVRVRRLLAAALAPGVPAWLSAAAIDACAVLIEDLPLLARVSVRNFIYMNQDTVLQAWRNALLRRHGAQTWCFTMAIGGGYLYTDGPEADHRFWAHQNSDHFVTASRQHVEFHRRHRQRVAHYHSVGNIWSELAGDVERRVGRAALRRQWFGDALEDRKVVAWFDTSFVQAENSISTLDEAHAWYGDLERFLAEFPDVYVVVKPSKEEEYFTDKNAPWGHPLGVALVAKWRKLAEHPRVYFPGHRGDPTSIIAASDLVITFCFSSVSAEALGAGRRAFWYEPGHRWAGTLYGRVPGLVAQGYAELVARARALLYETTDAEYQAYLDRHVRGVVEDFLDGRGLTRFRRLLAGSVETAG